MVFQSFRYVQNQIILNGSFVTHDVIRKYRFELETPFFGTVRQLKLKKITKNHEK